MKIIKHKPMHNHGPEEGKGLACNEVLVGECILAACPDSASTGWTVKRSGDLALLIDSQGQVVTATLPHELAMHIAVQVNMDVARHTTEYEQEGRELAASPSDSASTGSPWDALQKCRDAILGYKTTNVLHPDSLLNRALEAAQEALAASPSAGGQEKWTEDTVYDMIAEAFESGGEIRAAELIRDRHNATLPRDYGEDTKRLRNIIETIVRRTAQANCAIELNVTTAMQEFDAAMKSQTK